MKLQSELLPARCQSKMANHNRHLQHNRKPHLLFAFSIKNYLKNQWWLCANLCLNSQLKISLNDPTAFLVSVVKRNSYNNNNTLTFQNSKKLSNLSKKVSFSQIASSFSRINTANNSNSDHRSAKTTTSCFRKSRNIRRTIDYKKKKITT